jgi:L-alanine-DL-glutamate epimerase-like enolase superfamily enzyme
VPPRAELYDIVSGLPLTIDGYALERRELEVSSGFTRVTTIVALEGGGVRGEGEDVAYDPADHGGHPATLDLRGAWSLDDFSRRLAELDLFPAPPRRPSAHDYRRWAFESAALDLALRQAGLSLGAALGLPYRPVRFVVSTRREIGPWLAIDPTLEFKLDPTPDWTSETIARLAATGRVRILDLKGYHAGTEVEAPPDPGLYRACAQAFPDAILEDPAWDAESRAALAGHEARISWDAPIHSVADLDELPFEPRFLNIKPSRFGTVRRLLECLETCGERGITCYGGGQFELGPGRAQIQALASLFYPDAPNDVAPGAYNEAEPRTGLPPSPLAPSTRPSGLSFLS